MKTLNNKYLALAVLLMLTPAVHAMSCEDAGKELPWQNQHIREETGQLNIVQGQYNQMRAQTLSLSAKVVALDGELSSGQGFASQLQLLMQALDEVKRDFSPAKVDEATQAFQQFNGYEAAVAPIRELFAEAIRQTTTAAKEKIIGLTMDQLGQVIEIQSARKQSLETARAEMERLFQLASQNDSRVFDTIGQMGANIIRREAVRDDAQNSLQNCSIEREPVGGGMGRF